MKKNNKGFFLAETIVVIALVTTVMAFVYPNVSKLYDNYKNRALYYDQSEDIYILRAVSKAEKSIISTNDMDDYNLKSIDIKKLSGTYGGTNEYTLEYTLKELYVAKYMGEPTYLGKTTTPLNERLPIPYNLNKYLKRVKKVKYDQNAYRLIGVFELNNKKRYASIKIIKGE